MRWAGALVLLVCLALPSQPAVAQDRTPTRSAKELWREYPLDPKPTPSVAPAAAAPRASSGTQRPPERAPARSEGGAPNVLFAVLAFVAAAGAVALGGIVLRRRAHSRPAAGPTAGDRNGSPSPHAVERRNGDTRPGAVVPPDLDRPWTAALECRHTDAEARFCVIARRDGGEPGRVLADSGPLEWPPTGPAAVQALTEAAETLEGALLAGGWKSLPPGREWYAKRFAWEPEVEQRRDSPREPTRAGLFRVAAVGGAVVAGGAVIGGRDHDGLLAAPSVDTDAKRPAARS